MIAMVGTPSPSPVVDDRPVGVELSPGACFLIAVTVGLFIYGVRHRLFGDQSKGDWK